MSVVFFFLFGAIGSMTPFLALYFRSVGLSGSESSVLLSVVPVLLFISQPIFGPLTDRSGHRGRMLAILLAVSALGGGLIALGASFWGLLPLVLLWSFFSGPLVPIADSLALGEIQRTGGGYTLLRLWGSVGFVVTTTILGRLYNGIDLRWMFAAYAALNLTAVPFALRLPAEGVPAQREVWPVLKQLLKHPSLVGFLLLSALMQTAQAAHSSFFSLHMQSLGGSNGIIGLAWAVGAIVEVPIWLVLHRVARRVHPLHLLAFSGFMYSLRWFLFSTAPSPGYVLVWQLLAAFSFAIFMPTAVLLIGELVPDDLRTSGQALLVLVNGGIATVAGNVAAGYIIDMAGTATLYRVGSIVALVAGLGFVLLFRRTQFKEAA